MQVPLPYWRLSGFYFAYFGFVGAFTPFWTLYLQSLAFSAFQIAVLMSLFQIARSFSPSLWGWVADHRGYRVPIIRFLAAASLFAYAGVFFGTGFYWLFAIMLTLSFFWSASLPLIEAVTLGHLGEKRFDRYGHIRLWGSIGFIVAVIGLGYALQYMGMHALLWVILGLLLAVWLLSWRLSDPAVAPHHENSDKSWWAILRRREVIALMVACFSMSAAHGVYYTFYSIYLVDHGYSKDIVGWLWGVGVACEVMVFLTMPRLAAQFGLRRIMLASLFLAFVRFFVIGWAVDVWWLIVLAQVLHAATFGSYHAAAVALTHRYFKGKHQSKGQGLYTSISYGVGGTLGAMLSGFAWERVGPSWTFTAAACCAMLGFIVFMLMMRENED
ncbi:MFS transporter, PPP family, 3-phenylpropionic acid transporter [Methylobacillus rhizosphaerae]|uniref:MFS transporter, PPP family, 3-phenylpropionic acid transporter n=1 Tax=Methylobacillus rhizosphaerae TaxID=551994 RepID=A0A238Y5J6_9PROT|nr:MFS transporter [Methylobacillus rhizosphaerae]SNR65609.1 MFS transporter, PPP family, 3-phenylpropionic acid transporter [Methylobacillus rhizosphaerae]